MFYGLRSAGAAHSVREDEETTQQLCVCYMFLSRGAADALTIGMSPRALQAKPKAGIHLDGFKVVTAQAMRTL
jgi:hypothetical protein